MTAFAPPLLSRFLCVYVYTCATWFHGFALRVDDKCDARGEPVKVYIPQEQGGPLSYTIDEEKFKWKVNSLKEDIFRALNEATKRVHCNDYKFIRLSYKGRKLYDHEDVSAIGFKDGKFIKLIPILHPGVPVHFWRVTQAFKFKEQSSKKQWTGETSEVHFWTIVRIPMRKHYNGSVCSTIPVKKLCVDVLAFNTRYAGKSSDQEQYKHKWGRSDSGRSSFQYWTNYSYFDLSTRRVVHDHGAGFGVEWSVGDWHPAWPGKIIGYVRSFLIANTSNSTFNRRFDLSFIEVGKNYRNASVSTAMLAQVTRALDTFKKEMSLDFKATEATGIVGKEATAFWTHNLNKEGNAYEKFEEIRTLTLENELSKYRTKEMFKTSYALAEQAVDEKNLLEEPGTVNTSKRPGAKALK
eukprot:TRINITY_DN41976_c0_g1_i1.p1 TRINITY_DN41976_c0_g1~~TRINITY_DN41976_c0_g1_i1.p1  ORF type:complete len:409 (+),score=49.30 TRINITY_DN41976_c0_g1_i1:38-1264(+)